MTNANIAETAAALYASAPIWDEHSGFDSRPDANLKQLECWRSSGVSYLSVNVGYDVNPWQKTVETIASFRRQLKAQGDCYALIESVSDIDRARDEGKLAISFDVEGMCSLDGDINMVSLYYDLGVRQMLFAYNLNNEAGGGCHDEDVGLTEFGRAVIGEMNRVGMMVDCSHSAYRTTMEAMEISRDPAVFSHSNPRALVDHERNILDDQIKACAATGGVIGINGIDLFLGGSIAPETFVDHLTYIAEMVGVQHVGLGLDYSDQSSIGAFDEVIKTNQAYWPPEQGYGAALEACMSPAALPRVTELLLGRGFSEAEVLGILGGNFRAVAEKVWS